MVAGLENFDDYSGSPPPLVYYFAPNFPTSFPDGLEGLVSALNTLIEFPVAIFLKII